MTGGTSLIPGYKERLERDIKIQAQNVTDIDRIRVYTDSHRKYATWIGEWVYNGRWVYDREFLYLPRNVSEQSRVRR